MAELRFRCIKRGFQQRTRYIRDISKLFRNTLVQMFLTLHKMEAYLSKRSIQSVKKSYRGREIINRQEAEQVAIGLKAWALERGATHLHTGFIPLQTGLLKSTMDFLRWGTKGTVVENLLQVKSLFQSEPELLKFSQRR